MTNNFENENNDEFTEPEAASAEEPKKHGPGGNLAEAWRTSPLFKFMVLIVAVFAVGAAAVNFFGGSKTNVETARLSRPPTLNAPPGGVTSPYMRQQTELANSERAKQAIASGNSSIDTPLGPTADMSAFTSKQETTIRELRAETDQLKKQVQQQQSQLQQKQPGPGQPQNAQQREQLDNTLAEAMQRQMQQLLTSWQPKGMTSVTGAKDESAAKEANMTQASAVGPTPTAQKPMPKTIVRAGTVSYAQLLTEANSDVPGPILAQIVSGPLAGARAIGSFQVADGYEKYLVMSFKLADKNGKDYAIKAVALDPNSTLGGMATEVDERYFTRVVLPAAAGFLQGLGQALGQGQSSITTSGDTTIVTQTRQGFQEGAYDGLSRAAQTAGQFFQQQANITRPLVRVASGTPIGIFFVEPVMERAADAAQEAGEYPLGAPGLNGGFLGQGMNNVPYPNYATPGYGYVRGYPAPYGASAPYGSAPAPNGSTYTSTPGSSYSQYYGH